MFPFSPVPSRQDLSSRVLVLQFLFSRASFLFHQVLYSSDKNVSAHHVHSLTAAGQCNCTLHKCTSYKSTGTVQRAVVVGWEQQRYSGMGENNSGRWVLLETGTNLGGIIFCTNLMTKCRRKTQIARRFHNFRSWAQSKLIGMSWRIERCERHWTTLWKRCYFQPNAQFIGTWWPPWILVQMERSGSLWGCLPTERVIK